MIKNNFETSQKSLTLFPVEGKKIEPSYTGEQISSDGGLLLLREVENQTGLIRNISYCITDTRDSRYVDHSILTTTENLNGRKTKTNESS